MSSETTNNDSAFPLNDIVKPVYLTKEKDTTKPVEELLNVYRRTRMIAVTDRLYEITVEKYSPEEDCKCSYCIVHTEEIN